MASIVNYKGAILFNKTCSKCLINWKFRDFTKSTTIRNLKIQHNLQTSTTIKINGSNVNKNDNRTAFQKLDLTFTDTKEAYKSKKTSDLIRACLILKLSQFKFLVQNHEKVNDLNFINYCNLI